MALDKPLRYRVLINSETCSVFTSKYLRATKVQWGVPLVIQVVTWGVFMANQFDIFDKYFSDPNMWTRLATSSLMWVTMSLGLFFCSVQVQFYKMGQYLTQRAYQLDHDFTTKEWEAAIQELERGYRRFYYFVIAVSALVGTVSIGSFLSVIDMEYESLYLSWPAVLSIVCCGCAALQTKPMPDPHALYMDAPSDASWHNAFAARVTAGDIHLSDSPYVRALYRNAIAGSNKIKLQLSEGKFIEPKRLWADRIITEFLTSQGLYEFEDSRLSSSICSSCSAAS